MEVRALVITMHYNLAQVQLQIPGETLRDVETDASTDTLPDALAEVKRILNAGGRAGRCADPKPLAKY